MPQLILPSRFTQLPQQPAPIDQRNPITRGATAFPLAVGRFSIGAIAGIPTQIFGGTAVVAGSKGLALATTAAASDYIKLGAIPQMGTTNFTALVVVKLASIDASTIFESGSALTGTGSSNGSFQFRALSDGSLSVVRDNQAGIGTTSPGLVSAGKYFTVAVSFGGGSMRIALDGKSVYQVNSGDAFISGNFSLLSKDGTTAEKAAGEVALFVYWPRVLSVSEMASITDNPAQIFQAPSRRIWVASGSLVDTSLSATIAAVPAIAGTLTTSIPLAASPAALASATASLTTSIPIAGAAVAQASVSATLSTGIALSTTAAAGATVSASLSGGAAQLAGNAVASASASGTLTTAISLAASARASSSASANLAGGTAQLTGSASVLATSTGTLTTAISMSANAQSTVNASASLAGGAVQLAASAVATGSASAQLTTQINLSATANAAATASAAFSGGGALLVASATASSSAAASLSTAIALAGAAIAQASASAALAGQGAVLAASPSARAAASGALTTRISLAAAAHATAFGQAALSTGIALSAIAQAQASAAAQFAPTKPPTERVFVVKAESRVLSIGPESRVYVVDA